MTETLETFLPAEKREIDILETIANLSSDEVFTPPWLVRKMLDMLEENCPGIFSDPNKTFLDPACKSGIFLREIARRLFKGLIETFPDPDERRRHILEKQVYGIAITELTALMSRRTLYCSKDASGKYSASPMQNPEGNIHFDSDQGHAFDKNGKCKYCGAPASLFSNERREGKERFAYEFIHRDIKEIFNMHFDVVIGNPPYQLGNNRANNGANPIFQYFVENAIKCDSDKVVMIIPAKWLGTGVANGLAPFRTKMIAGNHIRVFHDFLHSKDCFPKDVEVKGGICFFLWDRFYCDDPTIHTHYDLNHETVMKRPFLEKGMETFIRLPEALSLAAKVKGVSNGSFKDILTGQDPFDLATDSFSDPEKYGLELHSKPFPGCVRILGRTKEEGRLYQFIKKERICKGEELIHCWKIFLPKAVGSGTPENDRVLCEIGEPGDVCTETFIAAAPFRNRTEAESAASYIDTRFFHYFLSMTRTTHDCLRKNYAQVPIVPWDRIWNDDLLNDYFGLDEEEASLIRSTIWPEEEEENE